MGPTCKKTEVETSNCNFTRFLAGPERPDGRKDKAAAKHKGVRKWELRVRDAQKWLLPRSLSCSRAPSWALPLAISQLASGRNSSAQSRSGVYSSRLFWSSRPRFGPRERTERPATLVSERRWNQLYFPPSFCGLILSLLIVVQNSMLGCSMSQCSSLESAHWTHAILSLLLVKMRV